MTSKQFSAILEEMEQLNQHISDKVPLPQLSSKRMFIVLLLVAILSGIIGYLIGVKTNRNEQKYIAVQPTISPTPALVRLTLPTTTLYPITPDPATVHWQTYTDATLSATFEYPTTWKLINIRSDPSKEGVGIDYSLAFEDTTVPQHKVSIYISSISYPENLSLADFYRKYLPGGAERFKNISFEETVNPYGIKFERIVQPYISPDNNDTLETVHKSRVYEVTKTIGVPISSDLPIGSDYHQDPKFQEAIAEYNHLINSFTFIDEGTN